jgi:hypothetical protein
MPVVFVILAFFVWAFWAYSRWHWRAPRTTARSFFKSMRDRLGRSFFGSMRVQRFGVPLSTGDTSKWN